VTFHPVAVDAHDDFRPAAQPADFRANGERAACGWNRAQERPDAIRARVAARTGSKVQRARAVVSAGGFQCRSDVISLKVPAGKTVFKARIGNPVDAVGDIEYLDVVEQALAFAEQADLEIVDRAGFITLAVVVYLRRLDVLPWGFD